MMMTANSLLNVDPRYNSVYETLDRLANNAPPNIPTPDKECNGNNAPYRLFNKQLSPSLFYNRPFNDAEDMDVDRGMGVSLEEIKSLNIRNMSNKNFLPGSLALRAANQANLNLEQLSLNSISRPSLPYRGFSELPENHSPRDYSNSPDSNRAMSRMSSEDRRSYGSGSFVRSQTSFDDDDDDDSWKVCGVCNDKATGYHFNALTCEGCKGFFRRSIKNGKSFTCSYNNQCSITKNNRRQCQACRLRKCIEIGMKRECIMSADQIQQKKTLVLSNRIKRAAMCWTPLRMTEEQETLLDIICNAFKASNSPPDAQAIRGGDVVVHDATQSSSSCPSPASSNSSTNNFVDLIKRISSEMVSRTPSNMTDMASASAAHVMHFTDIMEYSIKEVITFCKKIPTFMDLNLQDQIILLKAGCTEILFLKANYTYDIEKKALTLGPDILYTRDSFLQGGMSESYADAYLKFHEDLGLLKLDDKEMASLSAIALFSTDRSDITDPAKIDTQQQVIATALNAYTDTMHKQRNRFAHIMSFLPRLRTLNALCTQALSQVQKKFGSEIKPLVIEVQPDDEEEMEE